jgi:cytidine deaminase
LAQEASLKAYAPYSKFRVGCAIVTDEGQIFTGCNVENISYGLTICAERSAVFNAISSLGPKIRLRKVVIYTSTKKPVTPCGACRQVIKEFGDDNTDIVSACNTGGILNYSIKELLPDSPDIKFSEKEK